MYRKLVKIQYSKGIILNHVGPSALDTDLSKVFKNMCFDPKLLFAAFWDSNKHKGKSSFLAPQTQNFNFIKLVQINLSFNIGRLGLNKSTREYSLWKNYIFGEKLKTMALINIF